MKRFKLRPRLFVAVILMMLISLIAGNNNNTHGANRACATWLWHTQDIVEDSDQIIGFLVQNNVKVLYLQVHYDLDLKSYKNFIEKAFLNNINVHALEGSPEWVTQWGADTQQVFFNWVADYQDEASENQQFRGIHLDIEPYLNEDYHSSRNATLEYYQDSLTHALIQSEELGLPLSVSIPFWFDEVAYSTGYGEGVLAQWIISNIKNVVIMAYRDKALGDDGIINLVSTEIELAQQYDAVIIIAIETRQSDEGNNISFYEEGKRLMNNELKRIYKHYDGTAGYGGVAIHDLRSWMELKN